jgi:hypothetical protein
VSKRAAGGTAVIERVGAHEPWLARDGRQGSCQVPTVFPSLERFCRSDESGGEGDCVEPGTLRTQDKPARPVRDETSLRALVEVYSEVSRQLADAIDDLVRESTSPSGRKRWPAAP